MIGFLGHCIRRFSCIFFHAVEQSLAVNAANVERKGHGGWGGPTFKPRINTRLSPIGVPQGGSLTGPTPVRRKSMTL